MSIHLPTITILQETVTPVIQDGNRKSILLTIAGKPIAKSRYSLVIDQSLYWQQHSRLYHYNPSSVVEKNIKTLVVAALQRNNNNQPVLVPGKPVFFATFQFRHPNAHFINRDCSRSIREIHHNTVVGTSDTDNLCKLIMDAFNKIIYVDDRSVVHISCYKMWREDPTSEGSTTVLVSN